MPLSLKELSKKPELLSPGHRACAGCWSGYGKGDERFNKPLADIRIIYEKEGQKELLEKVWDAGRKEGFEDGQTLFTRFELK